jgi:hypothetical protein
MYQSYKALADFNQIMQAGISCHQGQRQYGEKNQPRERAGAADEESWGLIMFHGAGLWTFLAALDIKIQAVNTANNNEQ